MNELIERIVAKTGISPELARQAVAIILRFLNKDGPSDLVRQVIDAIPGARDLIEEKDTAGGGGMLGGLAGMMGGMGAMGALNELTSAGLDMSQVQSVTKEVVTFAKEKADEDTVDEIINAIPGLSQVV
ncbi:DUF2267 domain-containing protein [Breoghania sp. L-A4]|uniref:DUF2267 domain-containing protein n=1 Tax=Breoghania sp. L-A4 TaxID=2304600 RepID=UPI000E359728|nr:DUF2267 domain-containing protein [Breoghania sp. L-A4]AXS39892.1 DUF2267 domain-containing protein [Breoghania sp. L-A4]